MGKMRSKWGNSDALSIYEMKHSCVVTEWTNGKNKGTFVAGRVLLWQVATKLLESSHKSLRNRMDNYYTNCITQFSHEQICAILEPNWSTLRQ